LGLISMNRWVLVTVALAAAACQAERPQLALLWLLRDRINHDDLWQSYIKRFPSHSVRVYLHLTSDRSQLSRFFQVHGTVVRSKQTKWKTFSIVRAMNRLLREALTDPNNKRFVFLSESCIPLQSPADAFQQIMLSPNAEAGKSEFCFASPWENKKGWAIIRHKASETAQRTRDLLIMNETTFDPDRTFLKKSHQWCILSRRHAELLTSRSSSGTDTEEDIMVNRLGLDLLGEGDEGGGASDEHAYVSA
jgi:hypothetical protein